VVNGGDRGTRTIEILSPAHFFWQNILFQLNVGGFKEN
jgi:hypothetical protein